MATAITFKGFFPRDFKVKEMRLEILNGLGKVGTQMREGLAKTTATWDHDVEFSKGIETFRKGEPTVTVETDDEIYTLVNEGSPRHYIFPNGDYPLFFHGKYQAKTMPGVIDSQEGGPGEKDTFAAYVDHPGFPGRHFDEAVGAAMETYFYNTMEEAMRKAARASGWAL